MCACRDSRQIGRRMFGLFDREMVSCLCIDVSTKLAKITGIQSINSREMLQIKGGGDASDLYSSNYKTELALQSLRRIDNR